MSDTNKKLDFAWRYTDDQYDKRKNIGKARKMEIKITRNEASDRAMISPSRK